MDNEKIIGICEFYRDMLEGLYSIDPELYHVIEMTHKIPEFLKDGRKEKANRWLGFIQGVLCTKRIYTIDDLKNHNKPG